MFLFLMGLSLFAQPAVADQRQLTGPALIGPWLTVEADAPVEVALRWQTVPAAAGEVEYGLTPKLGQVARLPVAVRHELRLFGKTAGDRVYYRVKGPDGWTAVNWTDRPGLDSSRLAFLALSDMQDAEMPPPRRWTDVAAAALKTAEANGVSLLVLAGDLPEDNFPGYWKLFFDRGQPLLGRYPAIAVPGNHDVSNRVDYDQMFNDFQTYYPGPTYKAFRLGPASFLGLNSQVTVLGNMDEDTDQVEFAQSWLAKQAATPWSFVFYHHPPYHSLARHQDTLEKLRGFTQFFDGRVDWVLTGHIHAYQRMVPLAFDAQPRAAWGRNPGEGVGYLVLPPAGNWPEPYSMLLPRVGQPEWLAWPPLDSKGKSTVKTSEIGYALIKLDGRKFDLQVFGLGDLVDFKTAGVHLLEQLVYTKTAP